jgi:predicted  nucleic acid-binding Zn-ribbon protein
MTLEELADLIRTNSADTNGRIDAMRGETNAALMNIQNDLTDVRGELKDARTDLTDVRGELKDIRTDLTNVQTDMADLRTDMAGVKTDMAEVKRSLDLVPILSTMQQQIDALAAELAELKRRAS